MSLRTRRLLVSSALASVISLAAMAPAQAQVRAFNIPAAPAAKAIPDFARQAGVQIVAPVSQLNGVITPAVAGNLDAREALRRLLANTGLEVASDSGSVIVLRVGTRVSFAGAVQAPSAEARSASVAALPEDGGRPAVAVEEVVVSGSRVITNGNNSPTPVTAVSTETILNLQPTTISDALNLLPVFSGPRNQLSNPNTNVGSGGGGNGVANQLNLRNVGPQRTLVLLDGHRVPPTTSTGIVDADMIPQQIIKRVDVVTGGVSAVYGSDAISGVVNFIIDRNFNGLKANAQYGISGKGDGEQYEAGIAGGMALGSNAHIEGSYEYRDDKGILYRSSRPSIALWTLQGNGTTVPYFLSGDARRSDVTFGGKINSGVLAGQNFSSNGVLTPFVSGQATGVGNTTLGGEGAYYDGSLKAPLRSHQLYGRIDYDFSNDLHGYAEVAGNRKLNQIFGAWPTLTNVTISSGNAFLAPAYRAQLPANSTFTFGKIIRTAPRLQQDIKETQVQFDAGLEGKLGDRFKWDIAYVYGHADLDAPQIANVNNLRLSAALDAVINPATGQAVCNVTLTNPTLYPGCTPLNVFGPTSESAAAVDYILSNPTGRTPKFVATTIQHDVSASIAGSPFSLPAGAVNMAFSAEWRTQSFSATSDMLPASPASPTDCTGLRFNCNARTSPFINSFGNRSKVEQTVSEAAVEFDAPLVRDVPLIKSFNFNGALRYTNYDTSGAYTTWKAGIDWHISDDLRVRGTRSRDIRAPTLDDLYSPRVGTVTNGQDVLLPGNPTNNATRFEFGNPNLKAEIGTTTTLGVVFQPQALPGFSIALDAYDIRITDAINQIQGTNPTVQRACYASGGSSPYCTLQVRALGNFSPVATNVVTEWSATFFNIAEIHTRGADLEVNYATRFASRPLTLRGFITYQPTLTYKTPGLPTLEQSGVAFGSGGLQASPETRATLMIRYVPADNLSLDLLTRWRSSLVMTGDPTFNVRGDKARAVSYTSLNVDYRVPMGDGGLDLYLNIQNLFDEDAPPANVNTTQSQIGLLGGFPIGDDPVGRFFIVGLRYKF